MKVLITGSTGYLGRKLTDFLLEQGIEVVASTKSGLQEGLRADVEVVRYSLDNYRDLQVPRDIDAVIHLAARTTLDSGDKDINDEINAAKDLLEKCKLTNARLVFMSSLSAQEHINTSYARTKCGIEKVLRGESNVSVMRLGLVYGGEPNGLYKTLLELAVKLPLVPVFKPTPIVQLSYIEQVCYGTLHNCQQSDFLEYNIITQDIEFDTFLKEVTFMNRGDSVSFIYIPESIGRLVNNIVKKLGVKYFGVDRYLALSFGYKKFDNNHSVITGTASNLSGTAEQRNKIARREAIALLSHIVRGKPNDVLIERYLEATSHSPLSLSESLISRPWKIGLYDNLLVKEPALRERLIIASSLAEASVEGFKQFNYCGNHSFTSSTLASVFTLSKEVLVTIYSVFYRYIGSNSPYKGKPYHV